LPKVTEFQEKHAPAGVRIENTLQTNGTLLGEK
jgi:sulfatase maturation enzyme AslB (radical SAM superfamily)